LPARYLLLGWHEFENDDLIDLVGRALWKLQQKTIGNSQ
jgi:hypothetical protein